MKFFGIESIALALGLAGLAQAHMEMIYPAPFKSKANPFAGSDVDVDMTAPLVDGGSNFPCKGYHSLVGTDAGKPTADFKAGETYNMTITGGASHNGGSCQASLSFDSGKSWTVIHSYIGNCPVAGTSSYDFKMPSDTPSGDAIFAWTWFNNQGNREMYMNCAAITVSGGSKKRASALSGRPPMYVANINSCKLTEGADVKFPNPGPDVTTDPSSKVLEPKCGGDGSTGGDGSAGGDSGSDAPSTSAAAAPAPTQTQPASEPSTPAGGASSVYVSPSSVDKAPDSPTYSPGGVFITVSQPAEATQAPAPAPSNGGGAETSTLLTVTKPAPGTGGQPIPTSVGTPEPAPTTPAAPGSGSGDGGSDSGSGSGQQQTPGAACDNEGQWNCIGGTKYQRCASGQWTVLQSMAAGTTCSGSESMAFALGFGRKLALRARWV
ncbi:spore coat SP96 precursor [Fusarium albosuccineum]|uniref:Spore coat SP96 n=1 Tax=Fusarium albosuccineum TaxID=1237068 RepID=A0A8H4LRB8_9HYPO|nr:spore coat SP96 precursor [Fusarium albosuccineum]